MTHPNIHHKVGPAWVYRFYDPGGVLLYVGCTTNPPQRFRTHRYSAWAGLADPRRTTVEYYAKTRAALRAETVAIRTEFPYYQTTRETDWPAWSGLIADAASILARSSAEGGGRHEPS